MTPAQLNFLISVADKIPRLFKAIAEGNIRAEYQLGSRTLNGRQVKLVLVAEVVDPGDNPLSTHSKPMPESQNNMENTELDAGADNTASSAVIEVAPDIQD